MSEEEEGLDATRAAEPSSERSASDPSLPRTQLLSEGGSPLELEGTQLLASDPSQTQQLDQTLAAAQPLRGPDEVPAEDKLGRYLLLGTLGEGGMGVVYAAYDPELDRKLAIKVIRSRGSEVERARLQREAQAMARLNHAHVVAVHDVGYFGADVYVAMEYVEGGTLGEWLFEQSPGISDTVAMFCQAGEGLVAAHEAGLIHRDFKPDNVLVSARGQAKVTDFGLARTSDAEPELPHEVGPSLGLERSNSLTSPLTHAGAIMGTPAYMSPEQFEAAPTDASTDQFSFCVALYEALYGERPFPGDTFQELSTAVIEGKRRPLPANAKVPAWLAAVIDRGLATDPSARWPDMRALLRALRDDPSHMHRRWALVGGIGLLLALLVGAALVDQRRDEAECARAGAEAGNYWSAEARAQLEAVFAASPRSHAPDSLERVITRLDAWTSAWAPAREQACLAALEHDPEQQPGNGMDPQPRVRCLDALVHEFEAKLLLLQAGDAMMIDAAVDLVAALPDIETCSDSILLREYQRIDGLGRDDHQLLAELRTELSRAHACGRAGDHDRALDLARRLTSEADAGAGVGFMSASFDAQLVAAEVNMLAGNIDDARSAMDQVYFEAAAAGLDRQAFQAAKGLCMLESELGEEPARGLEWSRHQQIFVERLGGPGSEAEYEALDCRSIAHRGVGQLEAALADRQRALELQRVQMGAQHPELFGDYINLTLLLSDSGAVEQALESGARALELAGASYGEHHPQYASALVALAGVHFELGNYDEAAQDYQAGLEILEEVLGPEHLRVATTYRNLAVIAYKRGNYELGADRMRRVLAIREATFGSEHPQVGDALASLALFEQESGELDAAQTSYTRALAIQERSLGPEHPKLAGTLINLGSLHRKLGEHERALEFVNRGYQLRLAQLGESNAKTASARVAYARVLRARGQAREALVELRGALATQRELLDEQHPAMSATLVMLAGLELELDELEHARATLAAARRNIEHNYAPDHPRHAQLAHTQVQLHLSEDELDEAVLLAEGTAKRFDRSESREDLLEALERRGRPEDLARAAELREPSPAP